MRFSEFMVSVRDARFGFGVIAAALATLYNSIIQNPNMIAIWSGLNGFYHSASWLFRWLLFLGALLIVFFGKKMMGAVKFSFFFVIGFTLGAHFLTPIFPEALNIPAWLVGAVIGIVSGVLYRILYYVLFSVAIGYGTYILVYNGFYLSGAPVNYSFTRLLIGILVSLGILLVAFLVKNYLEIVITSLFGGWLATKALVHCIFNYLIRWEFMHGKELVGILVPTLIFAALGIFVQIKTRRRW